MRDLITACFDRLVPCIHRYGGTVDKFVGDEVMALFGAPHAHENDPERALRAALEMRQALETFNRERKVPLSVHFGVNTGLVYAGGVGGGGRQDYSVMGDAVNVAARLLSTATAGEIVVGADTHRQAGHLFDWETAGAVRVKGKAEAVTAYRLLGTRVGGAVLPTGLLGRGLTSPLVGRDGEVRAFGAAFDRLDAGEGGLLALVGEAGLGKSRLLAEMRREAVGRGLFWLEGGTPSFGEDHQLPPVHRGHPAGRGDRLDDDRGPRARPSSPLGWLLFRTRRPTSSPFLSVLLNVPAPRRMPSAGSPAGRRGDGRQLYRAVWLF